ncbi:MAG: gamma-glutamyl-gamma-aminobutyrate hydrolase family protein [Phycisphaerae bacterium]|nr:gamma-glutamyl-gamma-aminobutyrate hydrolase family protein [Phycisphaerae bacterium]
MTVKIGVSMNYRLSDEGVQRAYLDSGYFDFLTEMGAVVVPILPVDDAEAVGAVLDMVDGVLFTGGLDLDSQLWGEPLSEHAELLHPRRMKFEFKLYQMAKDRRLPIMGICLGLQMICVAEGGKLYQHLPEDVSGVDHGQGPRVVNHYVKLTPDSRLAAAVAVDVINVMSAHHQGVAGIGGDLEVVGQTDDGVIEAVEMKDYPFLLAVQWHPEKKMNEEFDRKIVQAFLDAAIL